MLRKDFSELTRRYRQYLFSRYMSFMHDMRFGVQKPRGLDESRIFMLTELLDKIEKTNRRVSPAANVLLPGCVTPEQFRSITMELRHCVNLITIITR